MGQHDVRNSLGDSKSVDSRSKTGTKKMRLKVEKTVPGVGALAVGFGKSESEEISITVVESVSTSVTATVSLSLGGSINVSAGMKITSVSIDVGSLGTEASTTDLGRQFKIHLHGIVP